MRIRQTGLVFDDPSQSTQGYILICPVEGNETFLLDPDGHVAHKWQTHNGMTNWSYLQEDGILFRNERCPNPKGVALTVSGRLSEYAPDGTLLWRHDDPYQHHDARRLRTRHLRTGAIYAAFTELSETQKASIAGGAPDSHSPGGPYGEVIREIDNDGNVVWEWDFMSLDPQQYPLHRNANRWSYGHTNTVQPLLDNRYLISSKNLNMLFILDKEKNAVTWRYQNEAMSGQHDAQMLDNGNIIIFANGVYQSDLHHSRILEIDPERDEIVWEYVAKDDFTSFFSPHMGGVQRLPSGNTLICEGNKGCLFEVNPEGEIVREFISPHFANSPQFGQINWLFRCRWYAPDSPEITALTKAGMHPA